MWNGKGVGQFRGGHPGRGEGVQKELSLRQGYGCVGEQGDDGVRGGGAGREK